MGDLNGVIIFFKNLLPLKPSVWEITFSIPKTCIKKANNKAEDDTHINIHLPISTNKNKGKKAINWRQTIDLLADWK